MEAASAQNQSNVGAAGLPVLLCLLAFAIASYSLSLPQLGSGISSFWLPNGLALAALLRTRRRQWPMVIAAVVAGNVMAGVWAQNSALDTILSRAALSAAQYTLCAHVLRRRFGEYFDLLGPRQLAWLGAIGFVTTIGKIATQLAFSALFHVSTAISRSELVVWVLTNFLGLFVLSLPILAVTARSAIAEAHLGRTGFASFALLFGLLALVFGPPAFPGLYMLVPLLMFLGWRHGLFGAGMGGLITIAVIAVDGGFGTGLQDRLITVGYSPAQAGAFLELFFSVAILVSLPVAVLRARQRATDAALASALAAAETRAAQLAESEAAARASEAALVALETRWRAALEGSGQGVWDWNLQQGSCYYSKVWKAMRGFADDEIGPSRSEWQERIHPDDIEDVLAAAADHLAGRRTIYESEHRARCKDGSYKWVLDRGVVVERAEDGMATRIIGTATDIDMIKQAALRADRHGRLYIALAACNAALARRGSIEDMFRRVCEILVVSGRMQLAWIGLADPASGLFKPVAAHHCTDGADYVIRTPVSIRADGPHGQGAMSSAFRGDRPMWVDDFAWGEQSWAQQGRALDSHWRGVAALPIRRRGQPVGVLSMYTEETGFFDENARTLLSDMASQLSLALDAAEAEDEARLYQQSLAASEQRFRAMFETAPLGMALMDTAQGRFVTVNPMFETIVGWPADELYRKTWQEITHPEDLGPDLALAGPFIAGVTSGYQFEKRYVRQDGGSVRVAMTITRFSLPGEAAEQHLCMIEDVTERRALEQRVHLAQRMDAIGQLTGGVAHDFNNLLTIVIGSSETLMEQLDDPHQQGLAELILQAADHGAELIRQLLAFARRQPLAPHPFDVHELLDTMTPLIMRALGSGLQFSVEGSDEPRPAFADPAQTEAAILNLCLNARDAMPDGGRLTIASAAVSLSEDDARRHSEARPGDYVEILVSDTGTGMSGELRSRIFEPFFTTKQTGRGNGLGLSMVYGFVQQSRGWLELDSSPGRGTVFRLYLPAARADAEIIALPVDGGTMLERGSENVLVVEDDDMVREHARSQFESLGYNVKTAANGADALNILEGDADIDLLFTDMVMPGGINGRQLADKARARRPSLRVLFTSGYSGDALVGDRRSQGGVTLLPKPYSKRDLSEKARQVLDEVP